MMWILLQAEPLPGGYGAALLQMLLALFGVCVLAWVVLRWGARRGLGRPGGRIQVLERVPLDPRRSLYLVQIGERVLLLGAGDGAAPTVLAELDRSALPAAPETGSSFAEILAKVRPRPPAE